LFVWDNCDQPERVHVLQVQGEAVDLVSLSSLWPCLLILHLRHASRTSVIVALPDSLPADGYRALLVACRWIAMHRADNHS
jgi:hypothetical protein